MAKPMQSPRDKANKVMNTGNQKPMTPSTYKKGGAVKKMAKKGGKMC